MYYTYYKSPFGDIALTANDQGLTALTFLNSKEIDSKEVKGNTSLLIPKDYQYNPEKFTQVCQQLTEYFSGERKKFDLPLAATGTPFQQKVWHALCAIKQGETKTYAWLAKQINNEKAVRAVGSANGANPIALIVPCHRIIGSNGKLTGYSGGLALKAKLLMHEGALFKP
ncbi:methylated-DNA--[protein]-cysteine S-methyltransferase [Candidatus Colwellia aromaticivorans]|uniref:methylated-DNA--[protein]-cysteine S-methyltransferase n=1 Tax=Candidatus Colwellia aromaticivorans TaxID=2267621 RepID=UPI000DF140C6|nr:methylated-DNA--[protein]-cysteine S-methyltransferase [Candidatus Colwellia aromaticivorans]